MGNADGQTEKEQVHSRETGAAFQLINEDDMSGIRLQGWTIQSVEKAIANTTREEKLGQELGIKMPGMLFDENSLLLSLDTCEFKLTFTAVEALRLVGQADPNIKVKAADKWTSNRDRDDVEITTIDHASDWTFTTVYPGTVARSDESAIHSTHANAGPDKGDAVRMEKAELVPIDYDALRDTTVPILYSSCVLLFEDELDDNGTASYRVRIRVMPDSFFVLARFFLRVDGVLIRVFDTRYFHRFGTPLIVRETTHREADLSQSLTHLHSSVLRDADMVAPHVPSKFSQLENILI